jgi:hypothetical protein
MLAVGRRLFILENNRRDAMLGFSCSGHIACPPRVQYTFCNQAMFENKETDIRSQNQLLIHGMQFRQNK